MSLNVDAKDRHSLLSRGLQGILKVLDLEGGVLLSHLKLVSLVPKVQVVGIHELLEAIEFSNKVLNIVGSILSELHAGFVGFCQQRNLFNQQRHLLLEAKVLATQRGS